MLATTCVDKPTGAGLWACDDTDATVSGRGEHWISDSGATGNMISDPTGFERYETAPPGCTVEMGDGTLLPVAGYGGLRLKIQQGDADGSLTRDLMLRRTAHVPAFRHSLLSTAQLSACSSIQCSCGHGPLFLGARATDSLLLLENPRGVCLRRRHADAQLSIRPQRRRWWRLDQRPVTS